ncbi:MAG: AMP-binding protein [Legionella longbeachae]|nr:AMP-binding protein [Legionella longbeachae]
MLLNHPNEIKKLVDLHYLLLGADTVPANEVRKWLSLCPWHQVINEYGPTETTVSVTSYFVNVAVLGNESSVPIGRPAFNTSCYVLDKYKNLCPVGIQGELYIGGAQVTKGYLNDPKLTEEKFIPVHFTTNKEIIYKTGDVVCWLPDKNLQFFGRNDLQVKIQGYRIELPAIESVLSKISGINQALVVVMTGPLKENYLRAYLVMDNYRLSSNEIRTFLLSHLPTYMIPREFSAIKYIPLKENEKIDFTALEQQSYPLLTVDSYHSVEHHLTPIEESIKKIWKKVFHIDDVDIKDDFFALGGDSLMAMQLISELKNCYHIQLPLQILFDHSSIARLAKQIEKIASNKKIKSKKNSRTIIKLAEGENESSPLFLVHPVGGSIFWYKQLASCLKGKHTIYGIQDVSVEGVDRRFNTLEEMAGYYLDEILKIHSDTIYCIGGASFGATVAFEIAHQLLKMGKQVQSLYLFDGWAHYPQKIMKKNTLDRLTHSENFLFLNQNCDMLTQLEEYRKNLLNNYHLHALPVSTVLFKASELWPEFIPVNDTFNGWSPYIQNLITVYKIPGNHETMFFDPHVHVLAQLLSKCQLEFEGSSI